MRIGRRNIIVFGMLSVLFAALLAACGGGGGGGGGGTVSGVAAAGAPLVGSVLLKDSGNPAQAKNATIAEDGSFSVDVSGLTPPFILKATGAVGNTNYTLYSFVNGAGIANINPLSNLALSVASGGLDSATIFATPSAGIMQTITAKLPASITDIQTRLQPLLALYDAAKANPITDTFTANHTGLDEVLDMVRVDVSGGTITVINKSTNGIIISGQSNDSSKWISDPSKIPSPLPHPVITPISATVKANETVAFTADVMRSSNKKVTWSVVETGGGTITDAGVYTAPAIDGTYTVKASSVGGYWVTATVKVVPKSVTVAIDPASATVTASGSKMFTATVTGPSNTKVTWSVEEQNGGNITSSGVYTAPATAGTYHVKAASVADPSKSATATVTVSADSGSSTSPSGPFPIGTWVGPNGVSFTVSKLVTSGPVVNQYAGTLTYSGGTINVSGTDTLNQIIGGSNGITVAVSKINGTSGTAIGFSAFIIGSSDSQVTELTGVLSIQNTPYSASDYMNINAKFTKH